MSGYADNSYDAIKWELRDTIIRSRPGDWSKLHSVSRQLLSANMGADVAYSLFGIKTADSSAEDKDSIWKNIRRLPVGYRVREVEFFHTAAYFLRLGSRAIINERNYRLRKWRRSFRRSPSFPESPFVSEYDVLQRFREAGTVGVCMRQYLEGAYGIVSAPPGQMHELKLKLENAVSHTLRLHRGAGLEDIFPGPDVVTGLVERVYGERNPRSALPYIAFEGHEDIVPAFVTFGDLSDNRHPYYVRENYRQRLHRVQPQLFQRHSDDLKDVARNIWRKVRASAFDKR